MSTLENVFGSCKWDLPEDFISFEHFTRSVNSLDWQSSPGYPYMLKAPTNEIFLGVKDGVPDPDKLQFLWELVRSRLEKLACGEDECDYIRLFVKAEPLKPKKVANQEYRIISSVSLVDQIIDHMLFDGMNDVMVDNWHSQPSKAGWSAYTGGWKVVPQNKVMALDKKSWDWSVNIWLFDMVFELRQRLCVADAFLKGSSHSPP